MTGHRFTIPGAAITLLFTMALAWSTASGAVPTTAEGYGAGPWSWPTSTPAPVVQAFDLPTMPWLSGHRGVDLDVAQGTTLRSPAAGVVVFAGVVVDRQVVSVLHAHGLRSTYEPVTPLVEAGTIVAQGDPIASVVVGHSPGALHWGARFGPGEYVNPLRMLVGPSVLKPWDQG